MESRKMNVKSVILTENCVHSYFWAIGQYIEEHVEWIMMKLSSGEEINILNK